MPSTKNVPIKGRRLVAATTAVATGNSGYLEGFGDYIGGSFVFIVGTVSGTSPTCDFSIATTLDDGTTDLVCFRCTQTTTTANHDLKVMFGPAASSDTDQWSVTATTAAAATGGILALPHPITDKIKITWTIGGTNPSYAITGVWFIPWRVL